jgi:hypothetical protein
MSLSPNVLVAIPLLPLMVSHHLDHPLPVDSSPWSNLHLFHLKYPLKFSGTHSQIMGKTFESMSAFKKKHRLSPSKCAKPRNTTRQNVFITIYGNQDSRWYLSVVNGIQQQTWLRVSITIQFQDKRIHEPQESALYA